jgi:hypothetical protein
MGGSGKWSNIGVALDDFWFWNYLYFISVNQENTKKAGFRIENGTNQTEAWAWITNKSFEIITSEWSNGSTSPLRKANSLPTVVQNTRIPEYKIQPFNQEKDNMVCYLSEFDATAEHAGWTDNSKALQLRSP